MTKKLTASLSFRVDGFRLDLGFVLCDRYHSFETNKGHTLAFRFVVLLLFFSGFKHFSINFALSFSDRFPSDGFYVLNVKNSID